MPLAESYRALQGRVVFKGVYGFIPHLHMLKKIFCTVIENHNQSSYGIKIHHKMPQNSSTDLLKESHHHARHGREEHVVETNEI